MPYEDVLSNEEDQEFQILSNIGKEIYQKNNIHSHIKTISSAFFIIFIRKLKRKFSFISKWLPKFIYRSNSDLLSFVSFLK